MSHRGPPRYDLYLQDFQAQLAELDKRVSMLVGCPQALAIVYPEITDDFPKDWSDDVATYVAEFSGVKHWSAMELERRRSERIARFPAYLVWKRNAIRCVRRILSDHDGSGDHALKEMWFMLSAGLVRSRVLAHPEFFPRARLRTKKTLLRHRALFSESGDELAAARKLRETCEKFAPARPGLDDRERLDAWCTNILIAQALTLHCFYEAALETVTAYLVSD